MASSESRPLLLDVNALLALAWPNHRVPPNGAEPARGGVRPGPRRRRDGGRRGRSGRPRRRGRSRRGGGGAVAGATAGGCAGGDCGVRAVGRGSTGGTAGDRYQVVVHVDADALTEAPGVPEAADVPAGTSGTAPTPAGRRQTVLAEAGGIHISAETARRLACDAATVGTQHGPAARSSMSAAARGPSRRPFAEPCTPVTASAGFRGAGTSGSMPTTSGTGPTAGRRRSTIWSSCAGATTGRFTKRGSASRRIRPGTWSSFGRTGDRCRKRRRRRTGQVGRRRQ